MFQCFDTCGVLERIHWPSLCLGIILGIFIGQLLELLLLFRNTWLLGFATRLGLLATIWQ